MSQRTKRQMAPPSHQDGPAHAYQTGFAPHAAVPTPGGQSAWWPGPLPQATASTAISTNCGMDYYPPGGFMNFLQTGQPFIPHVSAPWPPMGKESHLAPNGSGNQSAKNRSKGKTSINLDDGVRTAKRLVFDPDEDERSVHG